MDWQLLFTPLFVFLVFLFVSASIYWFGGKLALKGGPQSDHKLSTYACGEEVEGGKFQQSFTLFHVAFIFTIFHIAALIIVTMSNLAEPENYLYGLLFVGGLVIAAAALITSGGVKHA